MENNKTDKENSIPPGTSGPKADADAGAGGGGIVVSGGDSSDVQHDPAATFSPLTEEEFMAMQADVAAFIESVPEDKLPVVEGLDWTKRLIVSKNRDGEFYTEKKSQNNIYLMTRYAPEVRGIFILNEFSQRKMVVKCPPWEKPNKFRPRDVRDDDYARVCMELERMKMAPSVERVRAAIEAICHDRSFHPVQKYFLRLKWDRTPRLEKWLAYYLGAEADPEPYLRGIGPKWMIAAVARIFEPGCKFDHMLVLEGGTDIGKSKFLRKLSTFNGEEYFYDGMTFGMLQDKDTMQNIQGSLIIEFPELSSLQSRDVEEVKQWITKQEDKGRKPYGREPVVYPRQFILAGTTNNSEYFRDTTGNKRFWPVRCGDKIDITALERDREQLWAEAVHLYREGVKWWIPDGDPLIAITQDVQRRRMVTHEWEESVLEYIQGRDFVTVAEILVKKIEIPLGRIKRGDSMTVADILKMNGFRATREGKRRGWMRINRQGKLDIDSEYPT